MSNFYTIPHLEIPQRRLLDKPLWYYDTNNNQGINSLFKQMKGMTGYQYDNTHLAWSNIFGHLFSISVHYDKSTCMWSIQVWDHTGSTTLLTMSQEVLDKRTDVLSPDNYKTLCKVTENFVRGKILCTGCEKEIDKEEVAGTYFAGSYCEECWESKYKAIEAKETYN